MPSSYKTSGGYEYYSLTTVNTLKNQSLSKEVDIRYGQYFTLFDVINGESDTNVVPTTNGYKITKWMIVVGVIANDNVVLTSISSYASICKNVGTEWLFDQEHFINTHTREDLIVENSNDENVTGGYTLHAYAVILFSVKLFFLLYSGSSDWFHLSH